MIKLSMFVLVMLAGLLLKGQQKEWCKSVPGERQLEFLKTFKSQSARVDMEEVYIVPVIHAVANSKGRERINKAL